MTVPVNEKVDWLDDFGEGFSLGRDAYLMLSVDNGKTYYEAETARDISFDLNWQMTDVTSHYNGMERVYRPTHREFKISAEVLFDENDAFLKALIPQAIRGTAILVGAFTSDGLGPLVWATVNMGFQEQFNDVVKLSLSFNTVQFAKFFYDVSEYRHPVACNPYNPRAVVTDSVTSATEL